MAFSWSIAVHPPGAIFWLSLGLAWTLVCLAWIDVLCLRLPDVLTLPLLLAGLASSSLLPARPVVDHIVGAAVGWAALRLAAIGFRGLRGRGGVGSQFRDPTFQGQAAGAVLLGELARSHRPDQDRHRAGQH